MSQTSLPILYSFRRCPYAMRGRMALIATGQDIELREIILRAKPEAMLEASPKATVPVLVLPDGTVIDESLDIMHHALAIADPLSWYPQDRRAEIDALIAANDGPFKAALDRYKYPVRYPDENIIVEEQRQIGADIIAGYEKRLAQTGGGLIGKELTMADWGILPFVRQFAHVDRDWFYAQNWPHVLAWLDGFKESNLFQTAMTKHTPWAPGDETVLLDKLHDAA